MNAIISTEEAKQIERACNYASDTHLDNPELQHTTRWIRGMAATLIQQQQCISNLLPLARRHHATAPAVRQAQTLLDGFTVLGQTRLRFDDLEESAAGK